MSGTAGVMTGAVSDRVPDAARLRLVVGRLARLLRQQDAEGLTASQLSVLATVARAGRLRMSDLAQRERMAAPSISRLVAALEAAGLLVRTPDAVDGRSSLVALTPGGQRRLERMRARRDALLARQLDDLPDGDRTALVEALPVLERLVDAAATSAAG